MCQLEEMHGQRELLSQLWHLQIKRVKESQNQLYETSIQNTLTTDEESNHYQITTRGNIVDAGMPLQLLYFENPYFV